MFLIETISQKEDGSDTVKIPVPKVDTRNEIFHFFTFCSVLKIRKIFFEIIILLTNVFGDIKRSIKLPKTFSESIRRNCGQKVYFGSTRWVRPKLGSKRTLKCSKFGNLKFKPQYHRPDKCDRPTDRAPDPACPIVSRQ